MKTKLLWSFLDRRSFLWSIAVLSARTVLNVLLNENLTELLLAVLTLNCIGFFALHVDFDVHFSLLSLFFLHGLDSSSKIFGSSFPIFSCFCLVKSLSSSRSHFLFFFHFSLLNNSSLHIIKNTCSFETTLLASELNSLRFDMKTNLQAFACFYRAFLLNFRPHPSGHITRSFSLSWGKDSSAAS